MLHVGKADIWVDATGHTFSQFVANSTNIEVEKGRIIKKTVISRWRAEALKHHKYKILRRGLTFM
jgi:hypothetical protein